MRGDAGSRREITSKWKNRESVPIQSEWRLQESDYFSRATLSENGVISKLTTKKFCEIAVRLLSPSYCFQLRRVFRSGGRARIVAAGFSSIGSGKSNVGSRG
jgi:hypothetical protein